MNNLFEIIAQAKAKIAAENERKESDAIHEKIESYLSMGIMFYMDNDGCQVHIKPGTLLGLSAAQVDEIDDICRENGEYAASLSDDDWR